MQSLQEIYDIMLEAPRDLPGKIRDAKAAGKKVVGVLPYYVPEEILYAAEILPVGCWGGQNSSLANANQYFPATTCSLLMNITEFAINGTYKELDALAFSIPCDTFRSTSQNLKIACTLPHLICNYPMQNKSDRGFKFSLVELKKFRQAVEKFNGAQISEQDLHSSIEIYNQNRLALQNFTALTAEKSGAVSALQRHAVIKARLFMDKAEHTELVLELNKQIQNMNKAPDKKSIFLAGITCEPDDLLESIDKQGFAVVGDELAQETRQFKFLVPDGIDAMDRLARHWRSFDSCSLLQRNIIKRQDNIVQQAKASGAEGIIYCQMNFCDPEEFDFPSVRSAAEKSGIPLLKIMIDQNAESQDQNLTRLQAFYEAMA